MKKMMQRIWHRKKGFTLIELLIVVAIIGILAGIAIPNFLASRTKAKISRAFADMRAIANALEMYYLDEGEYPQVGTADTALTDRDYISSIPNDPFASSGDGRDHSDNKANDETIGGDDGFGYYVSGSTAWLLVSNGPDTTADVTSYPTVALSAGQYGGPDTQYDYGSNWYNPANGTTSGGDLGLAGP